MNYLDLAIIYLSCGSPFGVYYLINNYSKKSWVIPKSIFHFVFWIFYAIQLLHKKVKLLLTKNYFVPKRFLDSNKTIILNQTQKAFEKKTHQFRFNVSLFEVREIFDRYIGLTNEIRSSQHFSENKHLELFQISGPQNPEIPAICLNRRNRSKLIFHQKKARRDFIKMLQLFLGNSGDKKKLGNLALNFVKILEDNEAEELINNLLRAFPQTLPSSAVKELEKIYGKG